MLLPLLSLALFASPVPESPSLDPTVIQKLVDGLKDPDPDVRQNLASALAKIGTSSIEPLIVALKDSNSDRRAGAAYTLGLQGEAARAALPTLLELIGDDSLDVRRQASYALSRVVPSNPRGGR
ncbi:hypothetical protein BH11PLA2_BH11PLA2_01000 [soil metagenome]